MEFLPDEIQKKYNSLSPRLKEEMNSEKEVDLLVEILEENNISNNFDTIQKNISYLILGLIDFDKFKNNIVGESSQKVYQQIFNNILLPIIPLLENRKEEKSETTISKIQKAKEMTPQERQKKAIEYNGKDIYREQL